MLSFWQKKMGFWLCLIGLFIPGGANAFDATAEALTHKKMPPLIEPKIETKTLPNGAKVYYLKNTELPVFKMTAHFEIGSIYDTQEERGLSDFFMSILDSAGSQKYRADAIDETLELLAASISSSASDEMSSIALGCLLKDAGEVLDIYFDLIKNPAFEVDRVEVMRQGFLNAIKQRNESPISIAVREFKQSLYGQDRPQAWLATPETVDKVTVDRLKLFHSQNFTPDHLFIAASSPLDFDAFLKLINPYLKDWKQTSAKKVYPTNIKKEWQPSLEFIQKEGNQSALIIGHFGEKRFNPDKYKLILANEMLGGSTFGSLLGDRIRTELGLAYTINSLMDFATDYGQFRIATQTKSESTLQTVAEIKNIISSWASSTPLTQESLDQARDRILNRLVFEYESPFNIVGMRLKYDYYGYPPNYLSIYQKEIESVTLEQVREVLPKYFFPDKLKILVVGDKTKIPDFAKAGYTEIPLDEE